MLSTGSVTVRKKSPENDRDRQRIKRESVELGCCARNLAFGAVELSLFDHVNRLNAVKDNACATEKFVSAFTLSNSI